VTVNGSGTFTAAGSINVAAGSLTFSGSGTSTVNGAQINAGSLLVTGPGTQTLNSVLNVGSVQLSGTGSTTLGGSGNNAIDSFTLNSGTLNLAKSSGAALNGDATLNGGTVNFLHDNQTSVWTDLTLGSARLNLGNTTQSLASLSLTGNSIIDFGAGSSSLYLDYLDLSATAYLTLLNWSEDDVFVVRNAPQTVDLSHVVYANGATAVWTPYDLRVRPGSPVPEPAVYGAALLLVAVGGVLLQRRRTHPHRS